jgi:hypothetical protein
MASSLPRITWLARSSLAALVLALPATGLAAQQIAPQLPDYTEQQRWERGVWQADLNFIMGLRLARAKGMSVEEYGRQLGLMYAPSWGSPGDMSPGQAFDAMRRNYLSWPLADVSLVSASEEAVVGRSNRPYATSFGETGVFGTVTVDDYERAFDVVTSVIMDYLGLSYEVAPDGDHRLFTIRPRPPGHVAEFAYAPSGAAARDATAITGAWEGSYTCRGLLRAADMDLVGDGQGNVNGTLTLRRHADGPEFPSGTYRVKGTIDRDGTLVLQPDGWVERPANLLAQAFRGGISGDGRSLTGEVINYACGAFTARKR